MPVGPRTRCRKALLRAWRHPEVLDPTRGSTRGWLLRTVRNVLIDEWRARQVRREVLTEELPEVVFGDLADLRSNPGWSPKRCTELSGPHREGVVERFYRGTLVARRLTGWTRTRRHDEVAHPLCAAGVAAVLEEMGVTG